MLERQQEITNDRPEQIQLIDLEQYTVKTLKSTQKLQDEIKSANEMLQDSFNNNPTYHDHQEKVKEVRKGLLSVKAEIAKQPSVASLDQKVKDLRFELKEKRKTLSDLALDYSEQSGADTMEIDGQLITIVKTAKLVKSRQ